METVVDRMQSSHCDLGGQLPIHRSHYPRGVQLDFAEKAHDLACGMDALVGSASHGRFDGARVVKERCFEFALNSAYGGLAGVAVEARAVVDEIEPIRRHDQTMPPPRIARTITQSTIDSPTAAVALSMGRSEP